MPAGISIPTADAAASTTLGEVTIRELKSAQDLPQRRLDLLLLASEGTAGLTTATKGERLRWIFGRNASVRVAR
jgi:hypothetical protein